ncbi:MAG: CapA family protein, partial [Gammaproteobacteria bacterium]
MTTAIRLFLAGDVMTGRGIDQVLPHPSDPVLHEPYVRDARDYVALTEIARGAIAKPVDFAYIWGDVLEILARYAADVRIANLETAVTRSDRYWAGKGIHYRMHPDNVPCLTAAKLDCCVLANNHVLDWGYEGLEETLSTLAAAGIATAGAGQNASDAAVPSALEVGGKGRVLVFAFGLESSGIPADWAATQGRAGVGLLSARANAAAAIAATVDEHRREGDCVVVSIHWGGNWGYEIPRAQREIAHALIDGGTVDIIHGHSSHHAKGIEFYRGKPILYGCGDFVNDYEGISGHAEYRGDLRFAYLVDWDVASGHSTAIEVVPFQARRFSLRMALSVKYESRSQQ